MRKMNWIRTKDKLPPEGREVLTKIDDEFGVRNINFLIYENKHWWYNDMKMYVYYYPTHWRLY